MQLQHKITTICCTATSVSIPSDIVYVQLSEQNPRIYIYIYRLCIGLPCMLNCLLLKWFFLFTVGDPLFKVSKIIPQTATNEAGVYLCRNIDEVREANCKLAYPSIALAKEMSRPKLSKEFCLFSANSKVGAKCQGHH